MWILYVQCQLVSTDGPTSYDTVNLTACHLFAESNIMEGYEYVTHVAGRAGCSQGYCQQGSLAM